MAEQSFPFENLDTTESQFSQWARNFQSTGIKGTPTGTELKVTAAGSNLNILVATGQAFLRGHYYINTSEKTLAVTSAGVNTRIDIVVVELDPTANTIVTKIIEGTAVSSDPVAPTLTQTDTGIYQLPIATLTIPNSTLAITNEMIADVRTFMSHDIGLWTSTTRPANPTALQTIGFNTTINQHEYWNGTDWVEFTPTDAVRVSDYEATGDILVASAADTPTRLPIGAAGQVLGSNGTTASWVDTPSALKSIAVGGDVSGSLGNTAGNHIIDNFNAQAGMTYVDGVLFTADSTTIKHQNLSQNAVVEFYQNWTSNTPVASHPPYFVTSDSNSIAINKYISTNGTSWVGAPSGTPNQIDSYKSYDYINGMFMGGAMINNYINGQSYIYTSTDNISWTTRVNGTVSYGAPYQPVMGGGMIVMPFGYYNGMSSPDGITWTARTINPNGAAYLKALVYGAAGGWVSHSNYNAVGTSTDGITWTARTFAISTQAVNGSAYGGGVYVAVGNTGTIASSTAPTTTWTMRTSNFGTSNVNSVAYGAGIFVAVGAGGRITTSPDGTTWTAQVSGTTTALTDVRFVNSKFIATSYGGNTITMSTNGTTWTATTSNIPSFGAIAYVGSTYYNYSGGTFSASTDAITWASQSNFTATVGVKGNGLLIEDNSANLVRSSDGIYWTQSLSGPGSHTYKGLTYDSVHKYLATSWTPNTYNIYGSTNGITWTTRYTVGTASQSVAQGIVSNGTIAVAGFGQGTTSQGLVTSTDGFTWTLNSLLGNVMAVAQGNGIFVINVNNKIYTSPDGATWTDRGAQPSGYNYLTFANGIFITGTLQTMFVSSDGITWKRRYTPGAGEVSVVSATHFNGTTYVAGTSGSVLSIKWTTAASNNLLFANYGQPVALV